MRDRAVEEIRSRRRRLFQEKYGGSIARYVEGAIAWERQYPDKVVRPRRQKAAV